MRYKNGIVLLSLFTFLILSFVDHKEHDPLSLFPDKKYAPFPISEKEIKIGRFLFYDPILSRTKTISCSSCHKQEYAFSDSPNKKSVGINGDSLRRNSPPLFNLAWYEAMFWDGKAKSIEEQVFHPVRSHLEMDLNWIEASKRLRASSFYKKLFFDAFQDSIIDSSRIARVIGQFERSLLSYRSKYDKVLSGEEYFSKDEYQGFLLMNNQVRGACLNCHTSDANALGTTGKFSNNGLQEAFKTEDYQDKGLMETTQNLKDIGKFKIPSIRNLAFTAPYMHDGRFNTLEEVLDFYSEGINNSLGIDSKMSMAHAGGADFSELEKQQIIAFLLTMSDSLFITDTSFSNPFL